MIVVLGYREIGYHGFHGISSICRAGVRHAESLADEAGTVAVIFTGWSSNGGPSEAEQMATLWTGRRDIALICEPTATNSAENAVRSLQLIDTIEHASSVMVVCAFSHSLRVRFMFDRLYKSRGYSVAYRLVVAPPPSPKLILTELSSVTRMTRDRRRALRLLSGPTTHAERDVPHAETGH